MLDIAMRQAASWMVRNGYQADPTFWVAQAAIRYGLTDQQQAILLHNASR